MVVKTFKGTSTETVTQLSNGCCNHCCAVKRRVSYSVGFSNTVFEAGVWCLQTKLRKNHCTMNA